jgi:hypothetical protein
MRENVNGEVVVTYFKAVSQPAWSSIHDRARIIITNVFRPALMPTQTSIQWSRAVSQWYNGRNVKLTTLSFTARIKNTQAYSWRGDHLSKGAILPLSQVGSVNHSAVIFDTICRATGIFQVMCIQNLS